MASRHFSLEMGDVADIIDLLRGFEFVNKVALTLAMGLTEEGQRPDLVVQLSAWDRREEPPAQKPLASASVTCLATNLKYLRDVVIHALYQLDFQIALLELQERDKNS